MNISHVNEELARRLHQHATEEMGYLVEILPTLYKHVMQDNASERERTAESHGDLAVAFPEEEWTCL
jgi:hypothetical protein